MGSEAPLIFDRGALYSEFSISNDETVRASNGTNTGVHHATSEIRDLSSGQK